MKDLVWHPPQIQMINLLAQILQTDVTLVWLGVLYQLWESFSCDQTMQGESREYVCSCVLIQHLE